MLRAFVVDNDEKVASSKKHTQFKTRVQNHTLFETKMAKIDTLFQTKTAKKSIPFKAAHINNPYNSPAGGGAGGGGGKNIVEVVVDPVQAEAYHLEAFNFPYLF